jgi:mono/diheme cytochrome c family protein
MTSEFTGSLPAIRKAMLFAAPLLLIAVAYGTPWLIKPQFDSTIIPVATAEVSGERVYAANCAYCHGANGDGRGSVVLHPPARYFGRDKFKFATTANNTPSDNDLRAVIRNGIPGSAMPRFDHLRDDEITALISHLRGLTRKGLYERQVEAEIEKARKNEDDPVFKPHVYAHNAAEMSVPGATLEVPAEFPAATPESIARGKAFFNSEAWSCSKCHGVEGKGDGPQVKDPSFKNEDKTPAVPRDLTLGTYKGGAEPVNLYARIRRGIPGTPMPDNQDKPVKDVIDVIHYLQSIAPGTPTKALPATGVVPGLAITPLTGNAS